MTPAYVYDKGNDGGDHGHHLRPRHEPDRSMIAQVLTTTWRAAGGARRVGLPRRGGGAWYADAVNWAAARGIVKGYDTGAFWAGGQRDRELAAILVPLRPGEGYMTPPRRDGRAGSSATRQHLHWAQRPWRGRSNAQGALRQGNGVLDPQGTATREVAQMLMNELRRTWAEIQFHSKSNKKAPVRLIPV